MHFNDREEIIALTPKWKGERLLDGRPKVEEKYLKALKNLTLEEVWKPIFVKGYESQFEGRLHTLHDDGRKLIGRAVTATYCPYRPDLDEVTKDIGRSEGRTGTYNQWVIDNLMEHDVPVIDMYDKIYKGTFLGGNLTTALKNKTRNENGGAVIWGGVRDTEQMKRVENNQVYYRGIDPTPIRDFITAQIDKNTWTKEMLDLLLDFIEKDERAAQYRELDWTAEYDLAINGDPNDTQSAL